MLTHVICNNPDLFTNQNTQYRDQIQFISFGDYLRQNYPDLLTTLNPPGFNPDNVSFQEFNPDHVSFKELDLIMKLDVSNKEAVIHRGLQTYMEALLEFEFDEDTIDADFIHNIKIIFSANSYIEARTLLPNNAYETLIWSFHNSNVPMSTGITLLNDASERLGIEVTPNILKNHLKNYIYQLIDNHPNKDTLLSGATNAQTLIEEHPVNTSFDWITIATSFKDRSMDQIKAILDYFGKTHCMPNTENSISFEHKVKIPAVVEGISMFLNPKDYKNLSMTAKNVTFRTNQESASNCSIQ